MDRSTYYLGENIKLTVQLTCLVDYNVSNYGSYYPGLYEWCILNSNKERIFSPSWDSGAVFELIHEFHAGLKSGGTYVFHLGTTADRPADSSFDVFHWIPALSSGDYYFCVSARPGIKLDSDDDYSPIHVPFTIILPDAGIISFHERWLFNATLDKSTYFLGENITLTVQLTCLIDHSVSPMGFSYPGVWEWIIMNNTWYWGITMISPSISYLTYEFHAGREMGSSHRFHLGTTSERPANSSFDIDHWIPILSPGDYYFIIYVRTGIRLSSDIDYSPLYVPFRIESTRTSS
ncbi:MAG: hypothetical protein ACFFCQ_02575 [Promethearchaeota archaeon]